MKVGYLQFEPVFGNIDQNIEKIKLLTQVEEFDLLVLPELAFSGYNFKSKEQLLEASETVQESKAIKELCNLSEKKGCIIVSGFSEIEDSNIYNSSFVVSHGKLLGIYRKLHLFNYEKDLFTPGNYPLPVFNIQGVKLGLMICFDWAFPEVARTLALKGADIICHPSNLVLTYCQNAMITRSIENGVFTITANRIGTEGNLSFTGQSQITNPKGKIVLRETSDSETLKVVEITPQEAGDKFITSKNHLLNERREEFYL